MSNYKIILFDVDDTLLNFRTSEIKVLQKTFNELNYNLTKEIIDKYQKINRSLWDQYIDGTIKLQNAFDIRFELLFKSLGAEIEGKNAEKIYRKFFNEECTLENNALEICQTLFNTHDLYIISNSLQEIQEIRLKKAGLSKYIKEIYTSEKVGVTKPSAEFFNKILNQITCNNKKEILIVGDSLNTDILGGNNINIDTCWYNSIGEKNTSTIISTYEIKNLKELLEIV